MNEFEEIYGKYMKVVYNFVMKLSNNSHIAEEITQQTFVTALEKLDTFRGECKMSVWLCQIAKHEYFAYCKRQRPIVREEAMEEPCGESLEERFIDHAEQIRIHEVLHVLPEPYKEVFTLRVMAELSYKDISRLFGKSESWARVTYYRAKCMIVERLEGGGKDEV